MDLEYGKDLKEIHILANGKITKYRVKDYIFGKMEINMKGSGNKV